jgi:hypothetical protein
VKEGYTVHLKEQANEGCNFHGSLHVNKVKGIFHFSPGRSVESNEMFVRDIAILKQTTSIDFSHVIHHLSFGESVDFVNPLDNVQHLIENNGIFIFDGRITYFPVFC